MPTESSYARQAARFTSDMSFGVAFIRETRETLAAFVPSREHSVVFASLATALAHKTKEFAKRAGGAADASR